ncbi:hypothetical protein R0135_15165 [Congregibacter variabilis]|uniref:Uncharacterized protein n=1 Tax=Congregibacter variabilis TaxID=3081200 RepID=A0ABZ0I247_9GAMM|nr:hypothetical protein R0135_15165 [Congregibacter sp. IMCC43200]
MNYPTATPNRQPDPPVPGKTRIWAIGFLTLNIIVFAVVMYAVSGELSALLVRFETHWKILLALCLGMLATLAAGNRITKKFRALLVFWDWSRKLPVTRVFKRYLPKKSHSEGQLPDNPTEQEALWVEIYRKYRSNPAVVDDRNDFLLAQEITWLSFIILLFFGAGSLIISTSTPVQLLVYLTFLLLQYLISSIVARSLGTHFYADVLAVGQVYKIGHEARPLLDLPECSEE